MLFDKQFAGEIHEFGEVQDAEFAAGGHSADPTQGRPELLPGAQRGLWLGFEELGEGGDEGILDHVGSEHRVA